jgi:voltage-gated potassium channel
MSRTWDRTTPRAHPLGAIDRMLSRVLWHELSVGAAGRLTVLGTALVVFVGGVLMRVLDPSEYPTFERAWWWAIQTVTTVGYGDATPEHTSGRIVATGVMLWGIAFITVLVAATTSSFVDRDRRRESRAQFEELQQRLDRIEQAIASLRRDG